MATCFYSCWKYLEQSNVHMLPFVFFFSTQEQMHTHMHSLSLTHTHNHTHIYTTQARHSCHVILLGIMPTAKHVTYKKSLRHRERERGRNCAHLSVCESSLSSVSTVHTQGAGDLAATVICKCSAVWGQSILRKNQTRDLWDLMWNCSKEHAMFTVHCLNSWKASWKAVSEPERPKSLTFQDS